MARRLTSADIIGRESELAVVDERLARATQSEPSTLLIGGEAGVGKTRLVDELARRGSERGALVLVGGSVELCDSGVPMASIAEALRELDDHVAPDEMAVLLGEGGDELPFLAPRPDTEASGPAPAPSAGRVLELVLALIEGLATRRPVVLVSEDLHWADRSTLDLLSFLDRNLRGPVLLVGTFRSDELHRRHPLRPFLSELERSGTTVRIDLAPFDRVELALQVAAITGGSLGPNQLDELARRSEGNPFFVEELLAAGAAGPGPLPDSLRDILLGRVADLGERDRAVLRIASTLGVRVDDQLLHSLVERDGEEPDADALDAALHSLVDAQLLVAERDGYRFRHALLQEAIYDELLPGERRRLHARIAEALSTADADAMTTSALAFHWYRARMLPESLAASVIAAQAAMAVGAPAEALVHYERAIELWDTVPDAAARTGLSHPQLLARAAEPANVRGEFERSISLLRLAINELDLTRDASTAGLLHERLGHHLWAADQDGMPDYHEALRLVPADPPTPERATVLAGYAQILMLIGDAAGARSAASEAIELAERVGNAEAEGHARNTLGTCLVPLGRHDEGLAELRRSLAMAREQRRPEDIGRGLVNLCHSLSYVGRWDDLIEQGESGVAEARRLGIDRTAGVYVEHNMLDGLVALGRWDDATAREDALIGRLPVGFWSFLTAGSLAADRGDLERARAFDGRWQGFGYVASSLQGLPDVAVGSAALAIWERRPRDTRQAIDAVFDLLPEEMHRWRSGELLWRGTWAEADEALDARFRRDDGRLVESIERAERYRSAIAGWLAGPSAQGIRWSAVLPVFGALTEAEAARGRSDDEPAHWQTAIDAATDMRMCLPVAYGRFRLAETLVRRGGPRRAAGDVLAAAQADATRLGARPLLAEIVALGRRARLDLGAPVGQSDPTATDAEPVMGDEPPGSLADLSPREREVLALVAAGRTNRQIADQLFISPKTASVHVSNILAKLEVSTRGEAAAVAHRLGVTPV